MAFTIVTIVVCFLGLGALTEAATCTVIPRGHDLDDVPNILAAVKTCGKNGKISLPAPYVYNINQRMTTHLEGSTLEIGGTLRFSDDIGYWTKNSYSFDYQKQSTGWRITGKDYIVDGGKGKGGIDGNGQAWYSYNKGVGNRFGRPIPLHIVNSTRATFKNFSIRQPQFWAVLVDSSSYIVLDNFYVNATNHDPNAPSGSNYITNTDGIDTYRSHHITIKNWIYQGGDDCVAFKGNSTDIHVENFTAYGGPGIAFGSLGQYPDRYDIVENISIKNVKLQPSFQYQMKSGIYFKAWIGINKGSPPNGGGGGTGRVRNVTIQDVVLKDVGYGIYINTCLNYQLGTVADYCDTSTFSFSNIHFKNITGNTLAKSTSYPGRSITFAESLICSKKAPCKDLTFDRVDIKLPAKYTGPKVLCANAEVKGLTCEKFTL